MGPLGYIGFAVKKANHYVRVIDLISRQDARHRLVLGLAAGAAVFFAVRGHLRPWSAAIAVGMQSLSLFLRLIG